MSGIRMTVQRIGDGFFPTSPVFLEDAHSIPERKELIAEFSMARNPAQDRWFHAMLHEVVASGAWDGDLDSLKDYLKIATGLVSHIINAKTGQSFYVLKSTAAASMDKTRFQRWIRRVEWVLAERLGIDTDQLRQRTTVSAGPALADPEPETKPTNFEEPLDTRLAAFATTLRKAGTSEAVETVWSAQRSTAEVKALHKRVPATVKAIVDVAKTKGLGKISDEQFDEAVNKLIDKAVEGIAA